MSGAAPASAIRDVFGPEARAGGSPSHEDRPTVLCLIGFGSASLPRELFEPLVDLAGARASIHPAAGMLFVFAPPGAIDEARASSPLALADDYGSVRALTGDSEDAGEAVFPSGLRTEAIRCGDVLVPRANIRAAER